jgi:diguanylate cyclase (GGDEF)-like protein/PAS domain S-box-containing protein
MDEQLRLFNILLNKLPICVYFKDAEGRFTRVNEAMADRLGLNEPSEAIGRMHEQFFQPEYAEAVSQAESLVRSSGSPALHKEELEASEDLGDAWISVSRFPLLDGDENVIGTLSISQDMTARKFTEQALEGANAQLTGWVTELEQQSEQTISLSEMGEMLQTCLNEEEATTVINRYAQNLFSSGSGVLAVLKASRNYVETVAAWGDSTASEHIFPPEQCWALRRGRLHHMARGENNVRCTHLLDSFSGSSLCVPMMAQGEALGVLHLSIPEGARPFTTPQQRLATTFAERVGLALANLKLREQLRSQSIRDALTGLYNRRYMEDSLEREIRRASRGERPVAAIMVDLDHFKRFNDTFGHEAGDMLLREFGGIARAHIRKEDIACRYGGEEFLIILPDAPLEVAIGRAEDIREAVKRLELKSSGRQIGMVTASIGVAMFPEHAQTVETLVKAADIALYEAKHGGRDRVVLAVETYA